MLEEDGFFKVPAPIKRLLEGDLRIVQKIERLTEVET